MDRRLLLAAGAALPLSACASNGATRSDTAEVVGSIALTYALAKYLEANPERADKVIEATDAVMALAAGAGDVTIARLREAARTALDYDRLSPADQMALAMIADRLQADALLVVDGSIGVGDVLPPDMKARVYELAYLLNVAAAGVRDA